MIEIPLRLGLQQRVFPSYRAPFFEALAAACSGGMSLCAGQPRRTEAIETAVELKHGRLFTARNLHFFTGSAYLCWQAGLLSWLNIWQPQALIMEANSRYLNSPAAVRWMHERRRPVIGWGLGAPLSQGTLADMRNQTRQRFLASFDALIAYSTKGAQAYLAAGIDPGRVFIAPNAVAGRPAFPPPARPVTKPSASLTALFVGRLQARKRVDLLILACARLPEGLQPELLIVGDGPERAGLEALAAKEYPRAQFLGVRHSDELAPIYERADLFVLPGTGGLAVQEAMSYALPVVVAEADGTQADLVRTDNGWLVPPGDLAALTDRLANALGDLARLRRMGAASYRVVDQEINLEKMVEVFSEAIKTALNAYPDKG